MNFHLILGSFYNITLFLIEGFFRSRERRGGSEGAGRGSFHGNCLLCAVEWQSPQY